MYWSWLLMVNDCSQKNIFVFICWWSCMKMFVTEMFLLVMVCCYYVRRSISFCMHTKTISITEKKSGHWAKVDLVLCCGINLHSSYYICFFLLSYCLSQTLAGWAWHNWEKIKFKRAVSSYNFCLCWCVLSGRWLTITSLPCTTDW
jgi:hypothetical protein